MRTTLTIDDEPFRTQPIEGIKPLFDNLDNIAEALAYAEGEGFK
jgi:hypothetical protein